MAKIEVCVYIYIFFFFHFLDTVPSMSTLEHVFLSRGNIFLIIYFTFIIL